MRTITAVFASCFLVGVSVAGATPPSPWAPKKANPYRSLFAPQVVAPVAPIRTATPVKPPKPAVKCGLTMIPADPKIDPNFAKPTPKTSTQFSMRALDPPMCR
jgi:hypothetical protein